MIFIRSLLATVLLITVASVARAADTSDTAIIPYATFVAAAQPPQRGLFTVWHKGGNVYLELTPAQLDRDFVQTIVPASGLGGNFLVAGNTDHLPAEIVRFERSGDKSRSSGQTRASSLRIRRRRRSRSRARFRARSSALRISLRSMRRAATW